MGRYHSYILDVPFNGMLLLVTATAAAAEVWKEKQPSRVDRAVALRDKLAEFMRADCEEPFRLLEHQYNTLLSIVSWGEAGKLGLQYAKQSDFKSIREILVKADEPELTPEQIRRANRMLDF